MISQSAVFLLATIITINHLTFPVAAESTAVINTTSGPVQGEILKSVNSVNYAAFKGIRFGEAPIGYLRFKPPVPVKRSIKIINATVEGSDCFQLNIFTGVISGAEDCLFINVYTPVTALGTTPMTLKPVMAWIYGGGFMMGSSTTKDLRPDYILEKGVVFVSFNYRLGPFGFLGMNHPNATGNAGLKDQVLALKWIQDNIKKFGGNPNNVTIIGQSAGSASVNYHILSDAAAGLFHGAISMSGVPLNPWAFHTPAVALHQGEKLGALIGMNSTNKDTLLKAFYETSAIQLVNASSTIAVAGFLPFAPTLEDKNIATDVFLSSCSLVKYFTGEYNHVPQILGFTDREALNMVADEISSPDVFSDAIRAVNTFGIPFPGSIEAMRKAANTSTNGVTKLSDHAIDTFINQTSSITIISGIDQTQQLLASNKKAAIYYYHSSYHPERSPPIVNPATNHTFDGLGHGEDLAYLFYVPSKNFSTDPADPTRRTINRVTTMWTNFVKYGNPTPNWVADNNLNITWPESGLAGLSLEIGTELKVGPRPIDDFTKLIVASRWPLLDNANASRAEI